MLGTVDKAARVLDLFTPDRPEWGVTETAQTLGLPRSSAHDLLSTLADTGLLQRSEVGRYRLGLKLLGLGRTVLTSSRVRARARPVMQTLSARLQATVHLAVLDADEVVYLDKLACPRVPVSLSAVGGRLAPHCSAVGQVLLAHQPRTAALRALERCGMARLTERTPASIDRFERELDRVRCAGAAHDIEGAMAGVCCHAGPIFERGRVVAAISVSVPADDDARAGARYADAARAAGACVTRALRARPVTADSVTAHEHALAG